MKIDKTKEHSKEEKSYLKRRTIQLRQWERVLDKLISKADKAKDKRRRDLHHHIIKIQVKKDRTEVKLRQLIRASHEMWDEIKAGMEKSWRELREAFLKVSTRPKK